jgi:hypothetical protein
MEASSPPGRHHGLWYVLLYCVLEGKEKRQKEKDRDRKRGKFLFKSVIYSILFFYSFNWFFLFYNFYMQVFCYQHLLVFCTISEMADILLSALTGMCFYYFVQLCLVLYVVYGTYWYFSVCCQHLLACYLTSLLSCLVAL